MSMTNKTEGCEAFMYCKSHRMDAPQLDASVREGEYPHRAASAMLTMTARRALFPSRDKTDKNAARP
jgi:hypothetical protein